MENFSLVNSLLGTAGYPAIDITGIKPQQVAPVRNRTWAQIARQREFEMGMKVAGQSNKGA